MPPLDLSTLNPAQLEAVLTTEGPLLVLAGAGSGKTRVLTYRIAHLVEDLGVSPYQVLAITFTNKAAAEMRARLGQLLPGGGRGMWVSTFHAMCVRLLRADAGRLGFTRDFTIYDDQDSKRLMREVMAELGLDPKRISPSTLLEQVSRAKNGLLLPDDLDAAGAGAGAGGAGAFRPAVGVSLADVYRRLQERLARADAMDFDDLLLNAWRLLRGHPELLAAYQERFRYILVDEYQDTNHAQYELTAMLAAAHRNLMVVGDDDQSIYSWRGADLQNILGFERDYPEAKVVKLEQNYRSTSRILQAANAIIAKNPSRKPKSLFTEGALGEPLAIYLASDERDEGRWIASEIERLHRAGRPYADCAVFYRTNAQSRVLEDRLMAAGVPYRIVGGTRFFDRAEIRDVMAYLRLVVNPADDLAAKRIINVPRRGIGDKSVSAIDDLARREGVSFIAACELSLAEGLLRPQAKDSLAGLLGLLQSARLYRGPLRDIVELVVERSGLIDALAASGSEEDAARIENILEFYGVAAEFDATPPEEDGPGDEGVPGGDAPGAGDAGGAAADGLPAGAGDMPGAADAPGGAAAAAAGGPLPSSSTADAQLGRFMEWLALRSDLDSLPEGGDYVTLMTVHSAKGLEFPAVFISGLEDGLFPHIASLDEPGGLEEERRLAYVAITRAEQLLFLSHAQVRSIYGSLQQNPRSLFVADIPAELLSWQGVGSQGYSGVGWEKRGDRHGVFGTGSAAEPEGRVFGSGAGPRPDAAASRLGPPAGATAEGYFSVGDRVDHRAFGPGRVQAIDGDVLTIDFEGSAGTKRLAFGFAPLVRLEG